MPLAGRYAASGEITVDLDLKREIQAALIARMQNMTADVRARTTAGETLGLLGDPRFERRAGATSDCCYPDAAADRHADAHPIHRAGCADRQYHHKHRADHDPAAVVQRRKFISADHAR